MAVKPALTPAQNAARSVYDWTGTKLTREQTAQILYQAGFRGQALVNMVAIAGRESNYRPGIHGTASPKAKVSGDRGLFGINYSNDARLKAAGIIKSATDLFDPLTNARAAYFLSNGGTNLFPWGATKGGWASGGDPFYGTNRNAAAAAVQNAANQGLLGKGWSGGGTITAGGTVTPSAPTSQYVSAQQNVFSTWLRQQPVATQQQLAGFLKGKHGLGDIAKFINDPKTPQEARDYLNFLAQLNPAQQRVQAGQLAVVNPAATAAAPAPRPSPEMTNLLKTLGVQYPQAPQPTPALLAFLRGVGLNLSTAEDLKNAAIQRIGASMSDAMADIDRTAGRTKQNVTADLVRRGVLGSGEANTRYARQAEDVAAQRKDVQRTAAQAKQQAGETYLQARDLARQQALDRVISAEQEQATQAATSKAQKDALKAQQDAADLSWARQQAAQQESLRQQTDLMRKYAAQGVVV
jgi:hypothetical protein